MVSPDLIPVPQESEAVVLSTRPWSWCVFSSTWNYTMS